MRAAVSTATLVAVVVVIYLLASSVLGFDRSAGRLVEVTIPRKSSASDIAALLADRGVIRNQLAFKMVVRWSEVGDKLQPGTYELRQGEPYNQIVNKLVKGPPVTSWQVTVPEGFTVQDIGRRLSAQTPLNYVQFLNLAANYAPSFQSEFPWLAQDPRPSLEGYLFPKTYRVDKDDRPAAVIRRMLKQYRIETRKLDWGRAKRRNLTSYETLIVASLIEKEAALDRERPVIAASIYKRMSRRMRLQIDATVQYALPEHKPRLSLEDLAIESPYNTYRNYGLPPTPICNPGLASIKAALNPSKQGYLYYVLVDRKGRHYFTDSYRDFINAKNRAKRNW